MLKIISKNLRFYWQKIILTILLNTFLIFTVLASWIFTLKIQRLADKPLEALSTEIILQEDKIDKTASTIQTHGVIEPFNLQSFSKSLILPQLDRIDTISQISTALILWDFDLKNNTTIVGLNLNDPQVGLRKIEAWLTPQSQFFSTNQAQEVILERHFAKLLGYRVGGTYPLEKKEFAIVGLVDFTQQSNLANAQIFMPYQTALALGKIDGQMINQIYLALSHASKLSLIQKQLAAQLPQFAVITKDQLLSNLSTFHQLTYRFGSYFSLAISSIALLLILWILKINRLEFRDQTQIFHFLGWPAKKVGQWVRLESSLLLLLSLGLGVILATIFYWGVLPHLEIGSLFSQNFQL